MRSIVKQVEKIQKNKAMMGMLIEFVLLVAVIALVSVLVFQVTSDTREDLVTNSVGYNATIDADNAIAKIPKNLKILATAVVFAVIIYVVTRVIPMAKMPGNNSF